VQILIRNNLGAIRIKFLAKLTSVIGNSVSQISVVEVESVDNFLAQICGLISAVSSGFLQNPNFILKFFSALIYKTQHLFIFGRRIIQLVKFTQNIIISLHMNLYLPEFFIEFIES
jgi:hypothetical protein